MAELDRRQALRLLAALGVAGAGASACGDSTLSADPVVGTGGGSMKVGLLVPAAGGRKAIGDDIVRGFGVYLGLNGRQLGGVTVTLEVAPEGETAQSAVAGLTTLLNREVAAVVGVAGARAMLAIRETVRTAKVPVLGTNASPAGLAGDEVYLWRTAGADRDPGIALAPHVRQAVTGRVLLVAPTPTDGGDALTGFRDAFGRTDPRLIRQPLWAGENTNPRPGYYQPAVEAIRRARPAAIFCAFAGAAAVGFLRDYRAAGVPAAVYGTGSLTEGPVLAELREEARGIVTAMNYSPGLPGGANRVFSSAYRQQYGGSPSAYAMASYDAAQVLDRAIRLAGGSTSAQQINLELGRVGQVDSPRGSWQFNQARTPQQRWYLREVRRDGRVLANVVIRELDTLG
ncbi:MAG TPA: ABC transporter substrate-binding protein [Pilimelia sp.]|nr:ABC transporter substrate-binding protein [Pilimelia sp.]